MLMLSFLLGYFCGFWAVLVFGVLFFLAVR
jgi:hypothetical protein